MCNKECLKDLEWLNNTERNGLIITPTQITLQVFCHLI